MDVMSAKWLIEMERQEMEDLSFIHEYGRMESLGGDSLDEFDFSSENFPSSCSPKSINPYLSNISTTKKFQTGEIREKPEKQLKTTTAEASSSSLISFGKSDSNPTTHDTLTFYENINWKGNMNQESLVSQDYSQTYGQGTKGLSLTRDPLQNQEHVLAERKRREKLNMLFISLSANIPGLSKTDKTSVLGDAVKYLKQLQQRVKMLEEQIAKKMVESVVTVTRQELSDEETSSSCYSSHSSSNQPHLEIEARVSNKDVLIRIHCQKQKRFSVKILGEIEKLHLMVIHSSCMPFGECIMDMTIISQMDNGFSATAKDLVRNLQLAFLPFMCLAN